MRNLDQLAAQTAQAIVAQANDADALDVLSTKTLGVLQENGVYACALFLESRTSRERALAEHIRAQLGELLSSALDQQASSPNAALSRRVADHVANDLDALLLVKQLWEQTLIYVRYGAKAKSAQRTAERSAQGERTQQTSPQ